MLEHTISNLNSHISVLRTYIEINQEVGLNNMLRMLESLSIALFKVTHGYELVNRNLLKSNFPAVDLVDDKRRVAIQVTSNADAKKINHTLAKFKKFDLADDYDQLIIFGFVNSSKKSVPPHCKVLGIADLVQMAMDKHSEEKIQGIIDAIEQHTDFHKIHPYSDKPCLSIILNVIDRNAVKHRMMREGSHQEMVRGLNEITELISKGTIDKKSKGKSIDQFTDHVIVKYLREIRNEIGEICGIINESRVEGHDFIFIPLEQYQEIDKAKKVIIDIANDAAKYAGIDMELRKL
ncbi:SMEK domain-containing protein [Pseudomonas veronii]|uniref:SMEK domain-containing protein n=1 Tax=Pseudomonas veronii TaxID=76761 RepID=A0A7Y0ZZL0_PSEVE|nr:SMEK domain-containing protein [Pseudomonas veronii]NMY00846.1 SMEK domain-containing protein [Pseudomonas veronii]